MDNTRTFEFEKVCPVCHSRLQLTFSLVVGGVDVSTGVADRAFASHIEACNGAGPTPDFGLELEDADEGMAGPDKYSEF